MRIVGIFLLGFGITVLIPSVMFVGHADGLSQVLKYLACFALVPISMIVAGIAIIRRAEDNSNKQTEEPELELTAEVTSDPIGCLGTRLQRFDLNRLNWVGWLLLLATFGFVIAEAAVLGLTLDNDIWGGHVVKRLVALGSVVLAIGFFVGLRWLLLVLGISIYRR